MPTKEDCIYAAGYIDADGCITSDGTRGFRLSVSSTTIEMLEWFKSTFGSNINNQHLPKNENHNTAWKWVVSKKSELKIMLELIIPHMKIKKKQAVLVLDYLNVVGVCKRPKLSEADKQYFNTTKKKLKSLKINNHKQRLSYF